jgi:DNA-binding response OmpR family regulator
MKILVVEDEHKIARNIKQGLEQEAHIVNLAYDGLEGYDMASEEEYDIIILDLMLPEMDGIPFVVNFAKTKITPPFLCLPPVIK